MRQFSRSLFYRSMLIVATVGLSIIAAGCHFDGGGKDEPKEAWFTAFKADLDRTEQRFFEARYIQNKEDPFYLKEVLSKIDLSGESLEDGVKKQIQLCRDDFSDSWPLLTEQLERTQLIFSVTSALPAYKATLLLMKAKPTGFDIEHTASIAQLKEMVEHGTVFNPQTDQLELAPAARTTVVELAQKIAVRTLDLIASAQNVSAKDQSKLAQYRDSIRLLNILAAEKAGQAVSSSETPFIEDPLKLWKQLKDVYDGIFGLLARFEHIDELSTKLARVSRSSRQSNTLRSALIELKGSIALNSGKLAELQAREKLLLEKLVFATEKQFKMAKTLTSKQGEGKPSESRFHFFQW